MERLKKRGYEAFLEYHVSIEPYLHPEGSGLNTRPSKSHRDTVVPKDRDKL